MTLNNKIKLLLDEMGRGSKAKLSKYLDVPPNYITRWVSYDDYGIPRDQLAGIAKFFGVTVDYLLDDAQDIPLNRKIPVIGKASCGTPVEYFNDDVEYLDVSANIYRDGMYAVIAEGDSMSPRINDGDTVLCVVDGDVRDGSIVHYTINDDSGIKKIKINKETGTVTLIPLNPVYDSIVYPKEEIQSIRLSPCTHIFSSLQ